MGDALANFNNWFNDRTGGIKSSWSDPLGIRNMLSSGWNMLSGQATAQKQLELYEKQLELSKEQLYNGHQIEVRDLINAGLNPVLSAQGEGASTSLPQIPNLSGLYGEGAFDKIMSIWGQTNKTKATNSAINLQKSESALNEAKTLSEFANIGVLDSEKAKNLAAESLYKEQAANEKERYNQLLEETSQKQAQTQILYEQLKYAQKHAKTDYEIKKAQQRYEQAKAELEEKKNDLYYFDWVWGKGKDITSVIRDLYGVTQLGRIGKDLGGSIKGLPGFKPTSNSARSVFGYDHARGQFY